MGRTMLRRAVLAVLVAAMVALAAAPAASAPDPRLRFAVDGATVARHSPGTGYDIVEIEAPPQSTAWALTLSISTSPGLQ